MHSVLNPANPDDAAAAATKARCDRIAADMSALLGAITSSTKGVSTGRIASELLGAAIGVYQEMNGVQRTVRLLRLMIKNLEESSRGARQNYAR